MRINKTVTVRGEKYKMHQAVTGWIFVESKKTRSTYDVGLIVNSEIAAIESPSALSRVSNRELAQAWIDN